MADRGSGDTADVNPTSEDMFPMLLKITLCMIVGLQLTMGVLYDRLRMKSWIFGPQDIKKLGYLGGSKSILYVPTYSKGNANYVQSIISATKYNLAHPLSNKHLDIFQQHAAINVNNTTRSTNILSKRSRLATTNNTIPTTIS